MQQPDGLGAEDLRQVRVALLGGGQLGLVGALDQRAHPIDLGALAELHPQPLDQALDGLDRNGLGDDRLAPGRLLGEARDVEIAVVRHQQGARDRRGGHDQHAGAAFAALGLQGEALMHAEAVLLVDDGKA